MTKDLNKEELARYSRHIIIPEIGLEGQRKLKQSSVLVVGAGGLGSPVLLYLAAAGVGRIGIVDYDVVDDSNLQRQVLYTVADVGMAKADVAAKKIKDLNPHINVNVHKTSLNSDNALDIIKDYEVVADGTDNFPTRYLVNDACVLAGKVNVYASIYRFEGQISVFNYTDSDGNVGPNYRDIFPEPPPPGLLLFDALSMETRILKIKRDPANPLNGAKPSQTKLIDYEAFCNSGGSSTSGTVKEITVQELKGLKDSHSDFQLIDVREAYELEIAHIHGEHIPLGEIENNLERISKDKKVILHCRSGKRSSDAIQILEKHGFNNLYNLKGGILKYADEIDKSLSSY